MHNLISTTEFCRQYDIEFSFIRSLEASGLIQLTRVEEKPFIDLDAVSDLEKFIRLHFDLDINLQGIEAIIHLLHRMQMMQEEITELKNRLKVYE